MDLLTLAELRRADMTRDAEAQRRAAPARRRRWLRRPPTGNGTRPLAATPTQPAVILR